MLEDFHLFHLGRELNRRLAGRRVRAVDTAGPTRLRLRWTEGADDLLFLLTTTFPTCLPVRANDPPAAADWLPSLATESSLGHAALASVEKVDDDRVLDFHFRTASGPHTLHAEIRPIAPAVYLCAPDGTILHGQGPQSRSLRRPPAQYSPAIRPGRSEPEVSLLKGWLQGEPAALWASGLVRAFRRLGPLLVTEALSRSGPEPSPGAAAEAIAGVCAEAFQPSARFYLYSRGGWPAEAFPLDPARDVRLSSFPLSCCAGWDVQESNDLPALLGRWVDYACRRQAFEADKAALLHRIGGRVRQAAGRIHSLEEQLTAASEADQWRRRGEILLANLHFFGAGFRGESVEVADPYHPEQAPARIPLDPARTLKENAQAFFRRHRKGRQAAASVPERLSVARRRLEEAERLLSDIRAAASRAELDVTARQAPASPAPPNRRAQDPERAGDRRLRRFRTHGGLTVWVGRSAADNDNLTFKVGRPDDIWCHASDFAGSHVVLQWGRKDDPPIDELRTAAAIAAWYSGARKEPAADVRWTRCKFVQKVKGAPGRVRLMKSHTLRVAPALPELPEEE